ncbi:unnamed protein product [Pylaiella littoralis]
MDTYNRWLDQFRKFKHEWIHSNEKVKCFVVHAIPPGNVYCTKTHCALATAIGSYCRSRTRINHREKSISVEDGTSMRPKLFFFTDKARRNYPVDLDFDHDFVLAVSKIKCNTKPIDVLDSFGMISYKLLDFKRSDILRVVRAMESVGFGVLHNGGLVCSDIERTGEASDRYCSRLPHREDPVWLYT